MALYHREIQTGHVQHQLGEQQYHHQHHLQELIEASLGVSQATVDERIKSKPYQVVINNLRMVEFEHSPIGKLRVVAQSSSLIVQSIDSFWAGVSYIPLESLKKKLALDAEQMILICIYIALRAHLPDLFAHLKLAYQFATQNVRQTKLGYFVATFEMALDQILNMLESEVLDPGKAVDAAEDEDEIATKFSCLERVASMRATTTSKSVAEVECFADDDSDESRDATHGAGLRKSTQIKRLSTNNGHGDAEDHLMMEQLEMEEITRSAEMLERSQRQLFGLSAIVEEGEERKAVVCI